MIQPIKYKERVAINSLTGIKSSLPQIRSVVALTYLLYLVSGKKASIAYSVQNSSQGLSLKEDYIASIKDLLGSPKIDELIVSNPLLKSQIESLYVGLTLMYGLGRVSFVNKSYGMTIERTGGVRYPKKIDFASNMILLDLIMQSIDESERKDFLIAWLNNQQVPNEIELRVSTFLNVCIENNLFKLRNGDKDTYFQTEGLYLALREDDKVSLESDEIVGPARILNGMLKEGLTPWLSIKNSIVSVNKEANFNVESFSQITSTSLDIRDIKVDVKEDLLLTKEEPLRTPLQQIFYGAPGTGKSNTIKREVDDQGKLNYRTTFHPDSDYSTFVGCYKPKMKRSTITKDGVTTTEEKIVYSFEPQAFTNAYVQAWKKKDDVYLIIEEINRGNCAQIFGDLFQLLDRKNGESEYPVDADSALADYLQTALANSERDDIPAEVKNGTKLKLPSNLYIWATMNTSDQSLFPIDSAFKRRWEWKYMKIKDEGKKWKIDVKIKDETGEEKPVKWWDFIRKVNDIIASMTSSADKQLGYFFCKADKKTPEKESEPNSENDLISVDTFVSKVLFYLWNDVFKDYGFEDASLFQYTKTEDGKEKKNDLTFPDFYMEDSNDVNPTMVTDFVQKVMNWKKKEEEKN